MFPGSLLYIGIGAALGAWLRYGFGLMLNPVFPTLPLGTLAANLLGGLLMGLVVGGFAPYQALSPELRLAFATGFLGALTTFSTFSAEAVTLLLREQFGWAVAHIGAHLVGSLLMTLTGIGIVRLLTRH